MFVVAWEVARLPWPLLLRLWDKLLTGDDELESNTCAVSLRDEMRSEALEIGDISLCPCDSEGIEGKVVKMVDARELEELLCSISRGDLTSEDGLETGIESERFNVSVTVEAVLVPEAVADVSQERALWNVVLGNCACPMVVISAEVIW
jgi:hypothetical protein